MSTKNNQNFNILKRVVRFGETDAAGVIHFQNLLRWSHEAWEESLEKYGLASQDLFPSGPIAANNPKVALPIVHCSADFLLPINTGDQLEIYVIPEKIDFCSFQVKTHFLRDRGIVAKGLIVFV